MKSILKITSWMIISVMITLMALVSLCPMSMKIGTVNATAMAAAPSLCHSSISASPNMPGVGGCASFHLALMKQFLGDATQVMNVLLASLVFSLILSFYSRALLALVNKLFLNRLRHRFRYYAIAIKSLIGKKLLRYLSLLNHETVASLA